MADTTYSYEIKEIGDNGEFLSWATLVYLVDGAVTGTERFVGTSEEPPGWTGVQLARSAGDSWVEAQTYTIEERLGQYGVEWEREMVERFDEVPF